MSPIRLLMLRLKYEHDVVLARQRAHHIALLLGFEAQDQTRLATAVSELARNAFSYGGGGTVEFALDHDADEEPALIVRVIDQGSGIQNLKSILNGTYVSPTGMGLGLVGARRLSDDLQIETSSSGTTITLMKMLPAHRGYPTASEISRIANELAQVEATSPFEQLQHQNQELLRVLEEVNARQLEVERLNAELEETNRGVLALYAELDDRAVDLKRASELKSRFLSDVSHELRTPLTSVLNLSRLLLDRADGPLTKEQEIQVTLIQRAVGAVSEIVNDLLDLAKIEAGKTTIRPTRFSVAELFATLRGLCRPLVNEDRALLVFEEPSLTDTLWSDEGRISQILRNLISNAIKFTESGEIRVKASPCGDGQVRFHVSDTGIGIAPENHARIFEEFSQVDGRLQQTVRGTGLGLPLSRKLATLLGGSIEVRSELGRGSTFTLTVPCDYRTVDPDARDASSAYDSLEFPASPRADSQLMNTR